MDKGIKIFLVLFVIVFVSGCPKPKPDIDVIEPDSSIIDEIIVPESGMIQTQFRKAGERQICRIELGSPVMYKNYYEFLKDLEGYYIPNSDCKADNLLCIYNLKCEKGCKSVYVFETLNDIPKRNFKGSCGESIVIYEEEIGLAEIIKFR